LFWDFLSTRGHVHPVRTPACVGWRTTPPSHCTSDCLRHGKSTLLVNDMPPFFFLSSLRGHVFWQSRWNHHWEHPWCRSSLSALHYPTRDRLRATIAGTWWWGCSTCLFVKQWE
jgi:hypothetical protein